MKYQIFKNIVMVQGHSAVILLQIGSVCICLGDNGDKNNCGPNWELVLFRPYSKQWFYCKFHRWPTWRALDANPATCPHCGGKDWHHSVECYTGQDLRQ